MSTTQAEQPAAKTATPAEDPSVREDLRLQEQPMIPLDRLKPNPGNVRQDLNLNEKFLAWVKEGVEVPLLVREDPDEPGMCLIEEGHRRYFAAREVGLAEVPYRLITDDTAEGDSNSTDTVGASSTYLRMFRTNHGAHRINHNPWEQIAALYLANKEEGLTAAQIRKAIGLPAKQVKQALQAGKLADATVQDAKEIDPDWSIEEAAILAEFEDDTNAKERLLRAKEQGTGLGYVAERLRREKFEATEGRRLKEELQAAGVAITEDVPFGGVELSELRSDDQSEVSLAPELHKDCPGRGAYFPPFRLTEPVHYCADPEAHGHAYQNARTAERMRLRAELLAVDRTVTEEIPPGAGKLSELLHNGQEISAESHRDCPGSGIWLPAFGVAEAVEYCRNYQHHGHTARSDQNRPSQSQGPDRKMVREGNAAWIASATVRRDWLKQLFARSAAPKQVTAFVAEHVLNLPSTVRDALTGPAMGQRELFTKLTGRSPEEAAAEFPKLKDGRRMLLAMARLATAYEYQMAGENERKKTWRTDGGNWHCSRTEAGGYLRLLIELQYQPTPIESAVAQGTPYTGDTPAMEGQALKSDPQQDESSSADESNADNQDRTDRSEMPAAA